MWDVPFEEPGEGMTEENKVAKVAERNKVIA
jgi:hypothetical protein